MLEQILLRRGTWCTSHRVGKEGSGLKAWVRRGIFCEARKPPTDSNRRDVGATKSWLDMESIGPSGQDGIAGRTEGAWWLSSFYPGMCVLFWDRCRLYYWPDRVEVLVWGPWPGSDYKPQWRHGQCHCLWKSPAMGSQEASWLVNVWTSLWREGLGVGERHTCRREDMLGRRMMHDDTELSLRARGNKWV